MRSRMGSDASWTLPPEFGGAAAAVAEPSEQQQQPPQHQPMSGGSGDSSSSGPAVRAAFPGREGGSGDPGDLGGDGGGHAPWRAAGGGGRVGDPEMKFDARLLTKPEVFSGDSAGWREWKLKFVSYMESTDERFGEAMDEAARSPMSAPHL